MPKGEEGPFLVYPPPREISRNEPYEGLADVARKKPRKKLPLCGAKTRAGGKCRKPGSGAGGRCRLHGGDSAGPTDPSKLKGNQNARTHGAYAAALLDEDLEIWDQIDPDNLDDPIKLCDLQIIRVLAEINRLRAGGKDSEQEKDLRLLEITESENDKNHITRVRRRAGIPELHAILRGLLLRKSQLLRTKALMRSLGLGSTNKSAEDFARDIQSAMREMDEVDDGGSSGEMDDAEAG